MRPATLAAIARSGVVEGEAVKRLRTPE